MLRKRPVLRHRLLALDRSTTEAFLCKICRHAHAFVAVVVPLGERRRWAYPQELLLGLFQFLWFAAVHLEQLEGCNGVSVGVVGL